MFEHHHEKLLPKGLFIRRLIKFALISLSLIIVSLVIGMIGYYAFEELIAIGIFAAPIFHRFLHRFHLESQHQQNEQ
jgi:hypothetical protein